ncbi:methyl-accepting chemotaxis protein [Cytobacillus oceanisediminis]|uniref:Methyl-accepting chemotaxis protein n=1 Tax=Cytobacillus oceanisediminis TaxID=665099 RepID=A0A2V2ZLQ7_9BACI|nr:HAMP domain-containing methyl-accepting chemotaxis protein [Cytobacillus oceanisediminis]PWW20307.1 methyl-accepting chemotaxis protein [Cytobacillus oceanisediminis]
MKRLSSKIALLMATGLGLILIGNSIMLFFSTSNSVESSIQNFSMNIAENIAGKMNTEMYKDFLGEPEKNDVYWNLREQLNDFREKNGALYVYTLFVDSKEEKVFILVDGLPQDSDMAADIMETTSTTKYEDVIKVLEGKPSSAPIVHDPEYGDYLSAFAPIQQDGEVIGVLGVDINAQDVNSIGEQVLLKELPLNLIINLVLILFVIIILVLSIRNSLRPLEKISVASQLMADGDLRTAEETVTSIQVKGRDEISNVTDSFKKMTYHTIEMVEEIKSSSEALLTSSRIIENKVNEISHASNLIVNGIKEVAGATDTQLIRSEESAKAIEEMAIGIQRIAEASSEVGEQSNEVVFQVKEGFDEIHTIINKINTIKETVRDSSGYIEELGTQANEIQNVVNLISGIAEQTNLLALNAAIEAARAGEHGKGFAVVSQEVKNLAEGSKVSAAQIAEKLNYFKSSIDIAVENMKKSTVQVEEGTTLVNSAGDKFNQILNAVEGVTGEIQEVSAVTEELSAGSEEISASIDEFASLSKDTAQISRQVASSTDQQELAIVKISDLTTNLSSLAKQLKDSVQKFKI